MSTNGESYQGTTTYSSDGQTTSTTYTTTSDGNTQTTTTTTDGNTQVTTSPAATSAASNNNNNQNANGGSAATTDNEGQSNNNSGQGGGGLGILCFRDAVPVIVGIVVGSVAVVLMVAAFVIWYRRTKRYPRSPRYDTGNNYTGTSSSRKEYGDRVYSHALPVAVPISGDDYFEEITSTEILGRRSQMEDDVVTDTKGTTGSGSSTSLFPDPRHPHYAHGR
ncbi:hypothetical protein ON010_g16202 [Phytophthora cinnamomi]|nr:hypothetical protein ON010_g16202 [Phytophthora cinnamomi]